MSQILVGNGVKTVMLSKKKEVSSDQFGQDNFLLESCLDLDYYFGMIHLSIFLRNQFVSSDESFKATGTGHISREFESLQ